ncbi:hypothetical protein [Nitrosococcus halophilus]|uniref:hypothetical protein n=1 Tax=Nitrosococcus halophilus TaxID=133539 RepID=UPI0012FF1E9B|nr:hypothetical protein [Nitrosococcus halophilus]
MTRHTVNPSLEARRRLTTPGFPALAGKSSPPLPGTGVHRSAWVHRTHGPGSPLPPTVWSR